MGSPVKSMVGCWTTTLCALLISLYVCCHAQPGMKDAGSKDHQCHICTALVNETLKKLQPKINAGAQFPVTEAIANIESQENFYIYNYAPPTMMKALAIFMDNHDLSEVLEEPLSKAVRKLKKSGSVSKILDQAALERTICYDLTGVCVGANLNPNADSTDVKIDGVPQDVVAPQTAGGKAHVKRTKPDEL